MSNVTTAAGVRIEVDRELCFGFGDCVDTAPRVFVLDADDKASVIDPEGAPLEKIIEASQNCPVDAIIITGPDGVQIYP
jgi:ferredoxin